jgi:hypothetical protein
MNTKLHDLLAILIKEEKIYQEYSRLLFDNHCVEKFEKRGSDVDIQSRLRRLTRIAIRLEGRRQKKISEISQSFSDSDANKKLKGLFENFAAPAIKGLDDLSGVVNKMQKYANDCRLQSEMLINHSNRILLGSSSSFRHIPIENRHIPQGELAC